MIGKVLHQSTLGGPAMGAMMSYNLLPAAKEVSHAATKGVHSILCYERAS